MNMQKKLSTISELAEMLGVPVRKINLRDPNVFHREQDDIKRNPERLAFKEAVRFECQAMKAEIRGNGSYLVLELKGDFDTGAWSINEPDHIVLTSRTQSAYIQTPLFASRATLSPKAVDIIQLDAFQGLLKDLDLGPRESLHFYRNAVVYYAHSADAAKFLECTNALCRLIAGIASPQKKESRHADLPEPFADLNECANVWAISDDTERAAALENASAEDLRNLIDRVALRLPRINEYLDTHTGGKEAALGSLAETVSEAQIALQQRQVAQV